jgi:hypothetical protein
MISMGTITGKLMIDIKVTLLDRLAMAAISVRIEENPTLPN